MCTEGTALARQASRLFRLLSLRGPQGGSPGRRQSGMTLIELVMFIVIVSVGIVGILTVLNITARNSADPLIRKQMLAIAGGLIEEVEMQPFTWCDPNDPNVATATGTAGCTIVEGLGPETVNGVSEARTSTTYPFNNVNDYYVNGGYQLPSQIADITGNNPAPAGYSATITITPEALDGVGDATSGSAALRISVTVTHGSDSLTLEGYRTRHSPNFAP